VGRREGVWRLEGLGCRRRRPGLRDFSFVVVVVGGGGSTVASAKAIAAVEGGGRSVDERRFDARRKRRRRNRRSMRCHASGRRRSRCRGVGLGGKGREAGAAVGRRVLQLHGWRLRLQCCVLYYCKRFVQAVLDALQIDGRDAAYGLKSERELDLALGVEGQELLFAGE
jgi:hypothetical protein